MTASRDDLDALLATWPVDEPAVGIVTADGRSVVLGPDDRRVRLASVSKPLTALAVLVGVEEGTVHLDDEVGPPGSTLRHVLANASGLAFDDGTILARPGTRRIYSNRGYELAAAHLAECAGLAFELYQREAVFDPLGMRDTTLDGSPAHGAVSTVRDMMAVAADLLAPTVVHPVTLAEATTVQFPDLAGVLPDIGRFDPNPWGLSSEIRGTKQPHWTGLTNSPATFGHFGGAGTFVWVDPVEGVACVALTGRPFGPWALEHWPPFSDAVLEAVGGT